MLCVLILYISGGSYNLKSTPNDRFEKLLMAILFTLRVLPEICWEEIAEEPGFSSNKPTHYLLDHGDFKVDSEQEILGKLFYGNFF